MNFSLAESDVGSCAIRGFFCLPVSPVFRLPDKLFGLPYGPKSLMEFAIMEIKTIGVIAAVARGSSFLLVALLP